MICPLKPIVLADYRIKQRGVSLICVDGVYHVADRVGKKYYPNVLDIVEEGRWIGCSRRCEGIDYSLLTRESRLLLIHERAFIDNRLSYLININSEEERQIFRCPQGHPHHTYDALLAAAMERQPVEMCAGFFRHDLRYGISNWDDHVKASEKGERIIVHRPLACGRVYGGYGQPIGITPVYQDAIFMSLPLGGIEIVGDPNDKTHIKKFEDASRCTGLDVRIVKE